MGGGKSTNASQVDHERIFKQQSEKISFSSAPRGPNCVYAYFAMCKNNNVEMFGSC